MKALFLLALVGVCCAGRCGAPEGGEKGGHVEKPHKCDSVIEVPYKKLAPCPTTIICPEYEKPALRKKCPVPVPCPIPKPCPPPKPCPSQPICPPMEKCAAPLPCPHVDVKCRPAEACVIPEFIPIEQECDSVVTIPCKEPCWVPMSTLLKYH